jgi:hypothetical protein
VRVALEASGGVAQQRIDILTPSNLSVHDLEGCKQWETSDFKYTFAVQGFDTPNPNLQTVIRGLLDAKRTCADGLYMCGPDNQSRFDLLQNLKREDLVCSADLDGTVGWELSHGGEQLLEISTILRKPSPAVRPRLDIGIMDSNVFELMCKLSECGWSCLVKGPRRSKKALKSAKRPDVIKPEDYVEGVAFWVVFLVQTMRCVNMTCDVGVLVCWFWFVHPLTLSAQVTMLRRFVQVRRRDGGLNIQLLRSMFGIFGRCCWLMFIGNRCLTSCRLDSTRL